MVKGGDAQTKHHLGRYQALRSLYLFFFLFVDVEQDFLGGGFMTYLCTNLHNSADGNDVFKEICFANLVAELLEEDEVQKSICLCDYIYRPFSIYKMYNVVYFLCFSIPSSSFGIYNNQL